MEIIPGVFQLRIPIPFSLKYVNLYLVRGDEGLILIDCSVNTGEAFEAVQQEFDKLGLGLRDVSKIIITHFHPDHYGLIGRIKELTDAEILMHRIDADLGTNSFLTSHEYQVRLGALLRANGMPLEEVKTIQKHMVLLHQKLVVPAPVDRYLNDGEELKLGGLHLRTIWTPGHSPGHICMYDVKRKVLFSGDHLLAKITPHVGVGWDSRANPMVEYLDSLKKIGRIRAKLVLPAHGALFNDVQARAKQVRSHHDYREMVIIDSLGQKERSAYNVAVEVFGADLPVFEKRLALAETLAHLEWAVSEGKVVKTTRNSKVFFRRRQR